MTIHRYGRSILDGHGSLGVLKDSERVVRETMVECGGRDISTEWGSDIREDGLHISFVVSAKDMEKPYPGTRK